MKIEAEKHCYAGLKSDNVQYDKVEQNFDRNVYQGVAGEMIRRVFEHKTIDVSEITGRTDVNQAILNFANLSPFLKHWGFREECEYWMVGICCRPNKIPEGEPRPVKEIKFRARNTSVIPYIELFSEAQPRLPIKSIIVGPHRYQYRQGEAIEMLLEVKKMDVSVRLSQIPYQR